MSKNPGANRQGFSTRAIHAGYHPRDGKGALNPPVYMTSTYAFESAADGAAIAGHAKEGYLYGRRSNPAQDILEERLADLEGGEAGVVFASGMGAIASLLLTLLSAGDRVVAHETVYVNTHALFEEAFPRFGIEVVRANLHDLESLDNALDDRTKLVYFETPTNPTMDVLDIAAIAARAHGRGAKVAVDSTFASPALQRPLELGADYVLHSLTKFVSGHGDLLAGALIADRDTVAAVRDQGLNYITGAVIAPLNIHLLLRGLKTLGPRMKLHGENALALACFLDSHPAVDWVRYPGLESHPDHEVAKRQMANGGAMVAFCMKSGFDGASAVIDRLTLMTRAVSLGDAETLIMHPAGLSRGREAAGGVARLSGGVDEGLIRLSVGLEDVEDLIADFEAAFRGL